MSCLLLIMPFPSLLFLLTQTLLWSLDSNHHMIAAAVTAPTPMNTHNTYYHSTPTTTSAAPSFDHNNHHQHTTTATPHNANANNTNTTSLTVPPQSNFTLVPYDDPICNTTPLSPNITVLTGTCSLLPSTMLYLQYECDENTVSMSIYSDPRCRVLMAKGDGWPYGQCTSVPGNGYQYIIASSSSQLAQQSSS